MSGWVFAENPAFAGQQPRPLQPACHDRSPFITVRCHCGAELHLHETQLAAVPGDTAIGVVCKGCGEALVFEPGELQAGFARMRADGWIE